MMKKKRAADSKDSGCKQKEKVGSEQRRKGNRKQERKG